MKKVIIATSNPAKIKAAKAGFEKVFPDTDMEFFALAVESGVSRQPHTDQETLQGAFNRMRAASKKMPDADYWIGIEGGIEPIGSHLTAFAWIVVSDGTRIGKSRTGGFILPPGVASLIQNGMELGEADDRFFKLENSKQKNGGVGILTGNVIDRSQLYEQSVILGLIPLKNPDLYPGDSGALF